MTFCVLIFFGVLGSLRTSLLYILGELAGGGFGLWLLALVTSDRWLTTHDTGHMTFFSSFYTFFPFCPFPFFWYRCYPHTSRDSVPPVGGIFAVKFSFLKIYNIHNHPKLFCKVSCTSALIWVAYWSSRTGWKGLKKIWASGGVLEQARWNHL